MGAFDKYAGFLRSSYKYRKEKYTDTSTLLSILKMLIVLALSPDHGHS